MLWSEAYNAVRDMLGEEPIAHFAARVTYGAVKASRDAGVPLAAWPLLRAEARVLTGTDQPGAVSDLNPDRRLDQASARQWWQDVATFADVMQTKEPTADAMVAHLRSMPADNLAVMAALDRHLRAQLAAPASTAIAELPPIAPTPAPPPAAAEAIPPDADTRGHGDAAPASKGLSAFELLALYLGWKYLT